MINNAKTKNWILGGFGFGLIYWILDSVRDVLAFNKGTIINRIFFPDAMSLWERIMVVCILILFGVSAHSIRENKEQKNEQYDNIFFRIEMITTSLFFGLLYWILESVRDVLINQNITLLEKIVMPGQMVFWMRMLPVFVLLLFGIYAQSVVNKYIRKEELLKESEERQKKIYEYAPDAYFLTDLKGNFIDVNIASEKLFGYNKKEIIGKSWQTLNFLSMDQHKKALKNFSNDRLSEDSGPEEFIIINGRNGASVNVEIRTYPLKINNEIVILGIARDITERKNTEEKLRNSLKEKEVLLKEIHHRVKNNLQIISSLLNLQTKYIKNKFDLELFQESKNRIHSIALVHEKLYLSQDLAKIDFSQYITNLVNDLYDSYGISQTKIKLNIEVEDIYMNIDNAIPCGLIITELISNAFKHAFPPLYSETGKIDIISHLSENEEIELIVKDNGVGMPKGLNIKNTESLGSKLIQTLIEDQLNGNFEVDTNKGTKYSIKFHGMNNGLFESNYKN